MIKKTCDIIMIVYCLSLSLGIAAVADCADEPAVSVPAVSQENTDFADGLFVRGMYDSAIKEYERIIPAITDEKTRRTIEFKIAEAYFRKKDYVKSEVLFKQYGERYAAGDLKNRALLFQAFSAYELGSYAEALRYCSAVDGAQLDATHAALKHYYHGLILKNLHKYNEAADIFALVKDTGDMQLRAQALEERARCFQLSGSVRQANQVLEVLMKDYPKQSGIERNYLALGANYFSLGEFARSLDSFRAAEKIGVSEQDKALLYYGIVKNLYQLEKYGDVITTADMMLALPLSDAIRAEVMYVYGRALFFIEKYQHALEVLREIVERYGHTQFLEPAFLQIAWVCFKQQDMATLDVYRSKFAERLPGNEKIIEFDFLKAEMLYEQGAYAEAYLLYKQVGDVVPVFLYRAVALYKQGVCLEKTGDVNTSLTAFEAFIHAYPDDAWTVHAVLACIRITEGKKQYEQVLQWCQYYVERYVDGDTLETVYMKKAQAEYILERYDAMYESLKRILVVFPETHRLRDIAYNIGRYFERKQEYAEAIKQYKKALSLPNNTQLVNDADIQLRIGVSSYLMMQYDEARSFLLGVLHAGAVKDMPPHILLWLGEYVAAQKEYAVAIDAYAELKARGVADDMFERVLYKLALWYYEQQSWEAARAEYTELMEKYPDGELFLFARLGVAECDLKLGHVDKAKAGFEELSVSDVPFIKARAHRGLGDMYYADNMLEEAVRSYMFVTILFDDDEIVPALLLRSARIWMTLQNDDNAHALLDELDERFPGHMFKQEVKEMRDILMTHDA